MAEQGTDYINTIDYQKLATKLRNLVSIMNDLALKNKASRDLRYVEIDIEAERGSGKLAPDELYIPQHIIDTNIRREQSSYIQYITQSPRAVILQDLSDPSTETSVIEKDVTNKLRFEGWQLPMFANIDGFQQNGYSVMEVVLDQAQPGNLAHEFVAYGDFGMAMDTKNIQDQEIVGRNYYFSKTRLLAMCDEGTWGFSREQIEKVVGNEPPLTDDDVGVAKDRSLYRIQKVMFRVNGVVNVAWCSQEKGDDWIRGPRPLFIGRKEVVTDVLGNPVPDPMNPGIPMSKDVYETRYPYFVFPYLISENNTLSQLKGRVFLDQDCQQAAASLVSSFCTAHRRAAGLYFSKDTDDPNDDLMMQKNIFFASGALINKKVTQFQLAPPSSDLLSAVNSLITENQQETSQVNFAAQNRKDSRKTATEISAATQAANALSTVQVVLFSNSLKQMYETMFAVIQSRVTCGLIKVSPPMLSMYQKKYIVRPAGDVDVIERQQLVTAMTQALPIIQQTPAGPEFMIDLIAKMFPEKADKYITILRQAMQQQQSQQAQMQQQMIGKAMQMAQGVVELSKHKDYFSEVGQLHAYPVIEQAAQMIEQTKQSMEQNANAQPNQGA